MLKGEDDPAKTIQVSDSRDYVTQLFRAGIDTLECIRANAEYSTVLTNLPKAQIIVLIFAYKKACENSHFNFDRVYTKYRQYVESH